MLPAQDLATRPSPELVRVDEKMPGILIKLRYATVQNFTGKRIYPANATAWLRPETVKQLKIVQQVLRKQGYQLVIWDAYRPAWAQEKLWEACPDENFVAPPKQGSRHTRGTTVDVGMADLQGNLVEMPTDFDSFSPQASHYARNLSRMAGEHREILRQAFFKNGFSGVPAEWWHYDLIEWNRYPLLP
ncbi:MAG: M15 family metallopeptidase [Verrucomicrobiales bacterium]|nr:M15 family metallopeptidase [Verrucomicrobiales bacterium]